jgi:hypothetical protein
VLSQTVCDIFYLSQKCRFSILSWSRHVVFCFYKLFFSILKGLWSCKKEKSVNNIFLHRIFRAKLYVIWRNVLVNFNKWRPTVVKSTLFQIVFELIKEKRPITIKKLEKIVFGSISTYGKKSATVNVSKWKKHFFVLKHFILFFIFTFWCFWHHQRHVATHDKIKKRQKTTNKKFRKLFATGVRHVATLTRWA